MILLIVKVVTFFAEWWLDSNVGAVDAAQTHRITGFVQKFIGGVFDLLISVREFHKLMEERFDDSGTELVQNRIGRAFANTKQVTDRSKFG